MTSYDCLKMRQWHFIILLKLQQKAYKTVTKKLFCFCTHIELACWLDIFWLLYMEEGIQSVLMLG